MKKGSENNSTLKYLNPSRGDLKRPLSRVHTRSMVDLQAICNPSKEKKKSHFTSYNDALNETQFFQSNSISKMVKKIQATIQQPFSSKSKKTKNITNFNLKTMKQNINEKAKQNIQVSHLEKNQQNYQLVFKLKKYIEQLKAKEKGYLTQIETLKKENKALLCNASNYEQQIKQLKAKQSMLNVSIRQYENQHKRIKKDHQLVVESLKQVINEQITKIISLEKQKIEINKQFQECQQSQHSYTQPINMKSRSMTSRSESSSFDKRQTIREVTEENESEENLSNQQKDDKLLNEVDEYLSQWFTKKAR